MTFHCLPLRIVLAVHDGGSFVDVEGVFLFDGHILARVAEFSCLREEPGHQATTNVFRGIWKVQINFEGKSDKGTFSSYEKKLV